MSEHLHPIPAESPERLVARVLWSRSEGAVDKGLARWLATQVVEALAHEPDVCWQLMVKARDVERWITERTTP